jgi:hypothetical protein
MQRATLYSVSSMLQAAAVAVQHVAMLLLSCACDGALGVVRAAGPYMFASDC